MRVKIEMELMDVPGQLVKVLEPISRFGGNIQSVVHERERKTPLGRVPVTVIFDVDQRAKFSRILGAIREMGVTITRVGEKEAIVKSDVLMIGHIIDTDIRDTVNRLTALKGVMVSDLNMAVGGPGEDSVARMTIAADDEAHTHAALSRFREIAARKKLLVIESL